MVAIEHFASRDSQKIPAQRADGLLSQRITFLNFSQFVNATIYFNYQTGFCDGEINDVLIDGVLAANRKTLTAKLAEYLP